jgi:hypothetical protein
MDKDHLGAGYHDLALTRANSLLRTLRIIFWIYLSAGYRDLAMP